MRTVLVLAALAVLVGGGLSLLTSDNPDGLEWSMEHTAGTTELERDGNIHSAAAAAQSSIALLPDYDFADGNGTGTSASGLIGATVVSVLAGGTGLVITLMKRKKKKSEM